MATVRRTRVECTVRGALALTLRVSQCAGVAPLRFMRQREGWRVSVSRAMCVYSYLLISALHAVFIISSVTSQWHELVLKSTWPEKLVKITIVLSVSLVATIGVFRAPIVMNHMIKIINIIDEINSRISKPHSPGNGEKKKCLFVICRMVGVFLLNLVYLLNVSNNTSDDKLPNILFHGCYQFEYLITVLLEIQYNLVAFLVQSALVTVNQNLKDLIYIMDFKKRPSEVVPEAIRRLDLSYGTICQVVKQVDKCNMVVLLFLLGLCFIHLVVCPFHFILCLTSSPQITTLLTLPILYMFFIISALMIVEPGQRTKEEMELTGVLISKMRRRSTSLQDPLAMELDLHSEQSLVLSYGNMYTEKEALGYGIQHLNRLQESCNMFGGATTYLVILLQFQEFEK